MKKFLIAILLFCCLGLRAQEQIVYRYIIAEPQGRVLGDKCKLRIDDGIKPLKAKGDKEKYITFRSHAAALMYLTLQGWELVSNYNATRGAVSGGTGGTYSQTFWILRRPATKEEVQEIVDKSLKKED